MRLRSYIWDNVWVINWFGIKYCHMCLTEIIYLHWWYKSHRLRYQVVRSWWGSSYTSPNAVTRYWMFELTPILSLKFACKSKSWVLDQMLVSGRACLIRVFSKTYVGYLWSMDPCVVHMIVDEWFWNEVGLWWLHWLLNENSWWKNKMKLYKWMINLIVSIYLYFHI